MRPIAINGRESSSSCSQLKKRVPTSPPRLIESGCLRTQVMMGIHKKRVCPVHVGSRGSLHPFMMSSCILHLQLQFGNTLLGDLGLHPGSLGLRLLLGYVIFQFAQQTAEPLILFLKRADLLQKVSTLVFSSRFVPNGLCVLRQETLNLVL